VLSNVLLLLLLLLLLQQWPRLQQHWWRLAGWLSWAPYIPAS
jgi:hypothetical protein